MGIIAAQTPWKKVTPVIDMEVSKTSASWPARVEVFMKDGAVYSKQVNFATGHPSVPLSLDELKDKFRDNTKYGKKPFDSKATEYLIDTILNLENAENILGIMTLLG